MKLRPPLRLLLGAVVLLGLAPPATAQQSGGRPFSFDIITATENLVDGADVELVFHSIPDSILGRVEVQQCRLGPTYDDPADLQPTAGNCPNKPMSSSGDSVIAVSNAPPKIALDAASKSADGARVGFTIGTGIVSFGTVDNTHSLKCDLDADCALVVRVTARPPGGTGTDYYDVIPLSFSVDDAVTACGSLADGALQTGGGERLGASWSAWTAARCRADTEQSAALTRGTFEDEGTAVAEFARGELDLAYSSVGYSQQAQTLRLVDGTIVNDPRDAVATPVAINAAVVAVGGGHADAVGFNRVHYGEIRLTIAEVAAMFGGGLTRISSDLLPYRAGILGRNPELNGLLAASTLPVRQPTAPSNAQAPSWFLTSYLVHHEPDEWIDPRSTPPVQREASIRLGLADPDFNAQLDLITGIPALRRSAGDLFRTHEDGPMWVITDLATARALALTPVAIENADGEFVAPSEASMLAAVSRMDENQHGVLEPDYDATAAEGQVDPYPLTFVEYALAPAQPLVDDERDCLRTRSQGVMDQWLTYITTDGQDELGEGLLPLTSELSTVAAARIDDVGAAPLTDAPDPCETEPPPTTAPPTTAPPTTTPTTEPPASNNEGGGGSVNNVRTPAAAAPIAPAEVLEAVEAAQLTDPETKIPIPGFGGVAVPGWLGIALALIGIAAITSLAAGVTANHGLVAWSGVAPVAPRPDTNPARTIGRAVAVWVPVFVVGVALVAYLVGPLLQQRDQRQLLDEYRTEISQAAESSVIAIPGVGSSEAATAPDVGDPVGILEAGPLELQAVVVEGTGASQTRLGPGHVPGTAGPGQPGNSVIVARQSAFGGMFGDLGSLAERDALLVTTVQGQSVYAVTEVSSVDLGGDADALYGPSDDDRLTLITSASEVPWNQSEATVVVAELQGKPFPSTPQGGRTASQTGRNGDSGALASVALALIAYGGVIVGSVLLYRRLKPRVAYLLTIAPLVALTLIAGETVSRMFPAWM